ncbi:unnamed protein product [Linum trigynum]|uniref:Uncharacterized protein n=1 Tax=Linum trigynum TaxID=586398 RepID=A0AAV2DD37_9ROSI
MSNEYSLLVAEVIQVDVSHECIVEFIGRVSATRPGSHGRVKSTVARVGRHGLAEGLHSAVPSAHLPVPNYARANTARANFHTAVPTSHLAVWNSARAHTAKIIFHTAV